VLSNLERTAKTPRFYAKAFTAISAAQVEQVLGLVFRAERAASSREAEEHQMAVSYSWVKQALQGAGLASEAASAARHTSQVARAAATAGILLCYWQDRNRDMTRIGLRCCSFFLRPLCRRTTSTTILHAP